MAEIKGIVLSELSSGKYQVKVFKDSSCSSCTLAKFCSLGRKTESEDVIEVRGRDLKTADIVIVEENTIGILIAAALIFIFPIFAFVAGYYTGQWLGFKEVFSAISGFILMAVYFLVLRLFDARLRNLLFRFAAKRTEPSDS